MPTGIEDTQKKIEDTIEGQQAAVKDSEWADLPEIDEAQEKKLADAAKKTAAEAQYDDTSHQDGEEVKVQPVDDVPTAKTKTEENKEVEEPEFDPVLLKAAGLSSVEQARVIFGSQAELENAVRLMDLKAVSFAEQQMQQQQYQQQQQLPVRQPAQQSVQQTPAEEFEMPPAPDGEEWDDATVSLVKTLNQHFSAKLKAQEDILLQQKQAIESVFNERQQFELQRYVETFDGFVNELGENWQPMLGKGSGFELDRNSFEFKNRVHLDSIAKQLAVGRAHQGLPELSQPELLGRALRVAFPKRQEQVVRKQVENEVSKRQNMMTNRPTGHTKPGQKTGVDAAASFAEKWYAERGMGSLPGDDFVYDEI